MFAPEVWQSESYVLTFWQSEVWEPFVVVKLISSELDWH